MTRILGILTNLVPYHHARWQAFAQRSKASCAVLELTNKDAFSVLEFSPLEKARYERITLFPQQTAALSPTAIDREISRALDEQRPDGVCLNGYASPLALGALRWCVRHRVPAIIMSESTAWDEPRRAWKEGLKARLVRLCSGALVGGSPHADYLAKLGMPHERIFPGYDVVDNDHFESGAKEARSRELELRKAHDLPDRYFLASARFAPKKNLPRLLEAYARYRELDSGVNPWDLVILGDGDGRDALLALRAKLGMEQDVHLVGAKSYEELPVYYGLASAFIHASTTEQWGLVVNEAMASGLPVLVSHRCGCARDLVQDGVNGFTFDPYEVKDIAQTMFRLTTLTSQLPAMGKASEAIIANWSPRRFAEGLSAAVETALATRPPRPAWFDPFLIWTVMRR